VGYRRGSQNAPLVTTLAGHLRLAAISADGRRMKVRNTFVRDSDGARRVIASRVAGAAG